MYADPANNFNEVYSAFFRKSYLFVRSYVHDDMAAEDIASEALIKLWEQMKNGPVDPVAPYLFTILRNSALDYLKHKTVKRVVTDALAQSLNRELEIRTNALEACNPVAVFSEEVHQLFQATLNSLPEKTREIYLLSRFGGKPYKEIAALFGISVKGVDYHITQAVSELRISLKDYLPLLAACIFLN